MLPVIPDSVREQLLQHHAAAPEVTVQGGLSGSCIIRCQTPAGPACLRSWNESQYSTDRLQTIARAIEMLTAAGLPFIPRFLPNNQGETFTKSQGAHWHLSQWMPGENNYLDAPTESKMNQAMECLAKMHSIWSSTAVSSPSYAAKLRYQGLAKLIERPRATHWKNNCRDSVEADLVNRTILAAGHFAPTFLKQMQELLEAETVQHFALRDIWSDHVLYVDDTVTGIIDFGAIRVDEPATDLARLLGTMEPFSLERRMNAIEHYGQQRRNLQSQQPNRISSLPIQASRVAALDRASCLLSAVQWADWLIGERREFTVPTVQLISRWDRFLKRLEDPDLLVS